MPDPISRLPAFAERLRALADDDRQKSITATHPQYAAHVDSWRVHMDAFEGAGGFLTGEYLWPYPSEGESEFTKRQKMARYHNYVESLVDLYVRFLFTHGVKRECQDEGYNAWLQNVDGAGTSIDELLRRFAALALIPGHAALLVDKTPDEPTGPSRADETSRVFVTIFAAPSIADWRFEGNQLVGAKLIEAAPDTDLITAVPQEEQQQWLLWDREGWARFTNKGELIAGDVPTLGLVPLVVLRPKPRLTSPILGRALISNANVVRALYNRTSEEDEVLRTQAFSTLVVSVPSDGNVIQAREQLGNVLGASKALVIQGTAEYKTPDQNVPGAIRDNVGFLIAEIYRSAHMRYTRDSLAAESAEAIRLQYTELNEMLQGFAKGLAQAERDIARAYFAWTEPTPEAADAAFERAQVQATYPDEFFLDALITDLEAWAEAIRMDLGDTMTRRIKKGAARRLEPAMPPDVMAAVDAEIDALEVVRPTAYPLDLGREEEIPAA